MSWQRQRHVISVDALSANAKLLALNPDISTLWNHRREMLQVALADPALEGDARTKLVKAELELTVTALKKNPKSYCAWHQRQWAVVAFGCSLEEELGLCQKFLELDERNCACTGGLP